MVNTVATYKAALATERELQEAEQQVKTIEEKVIELVLSCHSQKQMKSKQ